MSNTSNHPPIAGKEHLDGLTDKQQKLVLTLAKQFEEEGGINATKAILKHYDTSYDVARSMGSEYLTKPNVRRAYIKELEARGCTKELASKTLTNAMRAKKRQRNYETGEIFYEPDHSTRLRAVKEFHKLLDLYPSKKIKTTETSAKLEISANLSEEELKSEIEKLEGRIERLESGEEEE